MFAFAWLLSLVVIHLPDAKEEWSGENVWIGLFTATYTLIQLLEGLIWSHLTNSTMNSYFAQWIKPALLLQPVVQWSMLTISYMAYDTAWVSWKYFFGYGFIYIMQVIFIVMFVYACVHRSKEASAWAGPDGHLVWSLARGTYVQVFNPAEGLVYMLGLLLPLLFLQRYALFVYGVLSCSFSYYKYWTDYEWGSMWCYIATGYLVTAIFETIGYGLLFQ